MTALRFLFFVCGLCATASALGEEPEPTDAQRISPNALVSLKLPETALIGDMVRGEFIVTNAGAQPFKINTGGDYRGAAVNLRLKVRVTDEGGNALPDLAKDAFHMGGMVQTTALKPGERKSIACPLEGYVAILRPGTYTVTAWHDLGWKIDDARPDPVATAKIEFKLPSAEVAAARVHGLCEKTARESGWELQHLQAPVFLSALRAEAKAGRAQACIGLAQIATEEAGEVLLELAASEDPAMARAAAQALLPRLPSLADPTKPAISSWINRAPRDHLLKTWPVRFDAPLLAAAEKLLRRALAVGVEKTGSNPTGSSAFHLPDTDLVSLGAQLIEARGGADQAAALLEATQRALDAVWEPRRGPKANVLDAPPPLYALIQAMDALRSRGWRTDGIGRTATVLAHFRQLADPAIPKPANDSWKNSVRAFMTANPPVFRENAVRAIPRPVTEDWEKPLRTALEDEDWGVVRAACEVAGESGRKRFIRPLAQVVETIHESFVQSAAASAALKLGGGSELWQAWCEVLPDKERTVEALTQLARGTIDLPSGGGSGGNNHLTQDQRFLLRDAWRTFLVQHRALLDSGKRVPRDDPSITPALTGPTFSGTPVISIDLRDGSDWPPRSH